MERYEGVVRPMTEEERGEHDGVAREEDVRDGS